MDGREDCEDEEEWECREPCDEEAEGREPYDGEDEDDERRVPWCGSEDEAEGREPWGGAKNRYDAVLVDKPVARADKAESFGTTPVPLKSHWE